MDMLLQMDFSIRKLEEFLSHSRIIYAWKKFHIWNRRKDLPNSRFIYPDKDSFNIVLVLKAIPCDLAHALARPRVILFPSSATNGNTFSSHHWDRGFKFFFFFFRLRVRVLLICVVTVEISTHLRVDPSFLGIKVFNYPSSRHVLTDLYWYILNKKNSTFNFNVRIMVFCDEARHDFFQDLKTDGHILQFWV